MKIHGWGRYPVIETREQAPWDVSNLEIETLVPLIPRGNGRSYGDSANAKNTLNLRHIDHFLQFDQTAGVLTVQAGATFQDILKVVVPHGWFVSVTPGTSFVTVGGAIASDVHGKNHHTDGSFCDHVISIRMMLGNGDIVTLSPKENTDLYHATCGGMGLTGVILDATLKLLPIKSSLIKQKTLKLSNLEATFEAFEEYSSSTYSVAWIDCLKTGSEMGRSVLMLGEHADDDEEKKAFNIKQSINIPVHTPSLLLNKWSMSAFNYAYYTKAQHNEESFTSLIQYFYPLDTIGGWNKLYGRKGFVQYQFVIPEAEALDQMKNILKHISQSGKGSFLAVLKKLGAENQNLLSFPMQGYTLALDFKYNEGTVNILSELDRMVIEYGGRIYLAKDAVMSEQTFKASYQNWEQFEAVRQKYGAIGSFSSQQSKRLGLA